MKSTLYVCSLVLAAAVLVAGCSSPSNPTSVDAVPTVPTSPTTGVSGATHQKDAGPELGAGYGNAAAPSSSARYERGTTTGDVRAAGVVEEFNCTNVQEVFVRFGHPGYAVENAVGLFVSYTGMPAGQKVLRIWWDYEGSPGAYEDVVMGEGQIQRHDDTLFDYSAVIEHAYQGVTGSTQYRVRAEVMIVGKTGNCARVRNVTVEPGDRVVRTVYTLQNGSFETGDLSGWTVQDLSTPYRAMTAAGAGIQDGAFASFVTAPTDGSFVALNGFDGNGPGNIVLSQLVTIKGGASTLRFDHRGGWDLLTYGATQNRTFFVEILDGGGSVLQSTTIVTAVAGTIVNDTGASSTSMNLSAYSGTTVRIQFRWNIPESFSGPGLFQLDNVRLEP